MTSTAFHCPEHGIPLTASGDGYACPEGCSFPVVADIPRFVDSSNYARSFGLQWNRFRTTQLDSHTGTTISRDRLTRLAGGDLKKTFAGKRVLEAGCGAGRFTELLLEAGASVTAVDLSEAVEANLTNCGARGDYRVCQADIRRLPFAPGGFDVVLCIGVVQHTPDPEETLKALARQVAPGGLLIIDHYTYREGGVKWSSRTLRKHMLQRPSESSMRFVERLVNALWPMHRFLYRVRRAAWFTPVRKRLLHLSPVLDYQYAFPELSPELLHQWAVLDTHDVVTDYYQHRRTTDEIRAALEGNGLEALRVEYAGNGVEAMARKPES
ncbi:methyltransferase domain-containing protein [Pseudodesulfovibrio portus]|uniref:Methyltransferase type 11 domain-containing protein n=1 Tax=Pseudodesulfovibrio portus TaxID=231439 RepID=A0ABM8AT62_9BACT|nr:methyltransferase domain-containing protein [Pseudodesulfovibrio portus]BDQ34694.1 hypothetical protein JCM14722_22360 [Pseudodesulfovibrio portus]